MTSGKGEVVLQEDSNMENWSQIKPVLQEFSRILGRRIYVRNDHRYPSSPLTKEGSLYIRFWSNPFFRSGHSDDGYRRISKAYGVGIDGGQGDGSKPSGRGTPIVDPDGTVVAEVFEDTLYVLFDLPHGGNADDLMRFIMEGYARLVTPKNIWDRLVRQTKLAASKAKKKAEESAKKLVPRVEIHIFSSWRNFREFFRVRGDLFEMNPREIRRRYDELRGAARLRGCELKILPGEIQIVMGPVTRQPYPDSEPDDIGKYLLVIWPQTGEVHFKHLTPKTKCHREVSDNLGRVCWGNAADARRTFLAERDFVMLLDLAFTYLETG